MRPQPSLAAVPPGDGFFRSPRTVTCLFLPLQKPDNPQTAGSFIPVANELKRKDKYMNVLFACHVRKVTRVVLQTRGLAGKCLVAKVGFWEAQGEEVILVQL